MVCATRSWWRSRRRRRSPRSRAATECIEPQISDLFKRETLSGDFLQVNRYLVAELKVLGLWTEALRARLEMAEGSVQGERGAARGVARDLPDGLGDADAVAHRHGGDRGAFIDQSQSLNLFAESPNIGQLSQHVLPRLEARPQDDLLPALAARHPHRQGHRRDSIRRGEGRRGCLLLARKPRIL